MSQGLVERVGARFSAVAGRVMPEPFVLALLLTLFVALLGLFGPELASTPWGERPKVLATGWFASFYGSPGLMKFALQMCIVLLTGHALAMAPLVQRGITGLCRRVRHPGAAVAVVSLVASLASVVQWGLGVIVGAFMAREMGRAFAKEGVPVHYPLLGAAGYAGFLVWHGGLSGSAPLKVAEPGHFLESQVGVVSMTETVFGGMNLVVTPMLIVVMALLFWALMPKDAEAMVPYQGSLEDEQELEQGAGGGVVGWLEGSRWLNTTVALGIAVWCVSHLVEKGYAGVNLDTINLFFLGLGLGLHRSSVSYARALGDGGRALRRLCCSSPFILGSWAF